MGSNFAVFQYNSPTNHCNPRERAKSAIIGGFVADAATMPLHWIYDQSLVEKMMKRDGDIRGAEFFDPPSCPFYSYSLGEQSPYGDEVMPLVTRFDYCYLFYVKKD